MREVGGSSPSSPITIPTTAPRPPAGGLCHIQGDASPLRGRPAQVRDDPPQQGEERRLVGIGEPREGLRPQAAPPRHCRRMPLAPLRRKPDDLDATVALGRGDQPAQVAQPVEAVDDVLRIGGWGDEYRALVKFDLDGLPASASHAEVRLWNNQDGGVGGPGVLVDYLTSPWDWRTSGSGSDHERLWWADRPSSTPLAGPLGAVPAGSWLVLDVTALYNQWQTGALVNEGLQLRPTSTSNRFSHFLSSENAVDVALRPVLEVTP